MKHITLRIAIVCLLTAPPMAGGLGDAAGAEPTTGPQAQPKTPTPPTAPAKSPETQGYTYKPEGRRDPFVSLLGSGSDAKNAAATARPAGLAGLSASEVALKGTMQSRSGYVALLRGADSKTYIVRAGDRLFDGTVRAITADAMVILQQVSDPLSKQKEREIRKTLRQADEVK